VSSSFYLLIEALEHVGSFHVLIMLKRQTVIVEGLRNVFLNPFAQFRVLFLPAIKPLGQILLGFAQIAAVVEPAKLLEAVIICFSRQVVQSIS
jgi:hypothetical protein